MAVGHDAEEESSDDRAGDRTGGHGHQEAALLAEHGEAGVSAVSGEGHQHGRQRHGQGQAARDLDVNSVQQHDRRDQQLSPGYPHEGRHDPYGCPGGHPSDKSHNRR